MTNNHKNSKTNANTKFPKNNSEEFYEVEIEKNFFIKTRDKSRPHLEKWYLGRKNSNKLDL